MTVPSLTPFKACTKCGCIKPAILSFFYHRGDRAYLLRSTCKVCDSVDATAHRAKKRVGVAPRRSPKGIDPVKRASSHKRYQEKHAEAIAERMRVRYQERKEEYKQRALAWQKANPERCKLQQRARLAAPGRHTADDLLCMYEDQEGLCAYCDAPLFGVYHVDHMVPISRGGSKEWTNLAITCPSCNMRKHTKTTEEFIEELRNT